MFTRVLQNPCQVSLCNNTAYKLSTISVEVMAESSKSTGVSDFQEQTESTQSTLRAETWKPLNDEIKSLVDTLCNLDNDETKSVDIIAEHTERITNAIPPNPSDFWYPKPIHHLLFVRPLQRAEIPLDVLEVLVSSGFDVNQHHNSDDKGDRCHGERMTCLHLAIKNRHYNAARWLVQHGADCDKCSYDIAVSRDLITPLSVLAAHKDALVDLLDLLITSENMNGNPHRQIALPLHVAAEHGHVNIALHLIDQGASVNQVGINGRLPLHLSMIKGHTELALSLIKHGAAVNREASDGNLPLHLAAREGHAELVLSLIKHGASVNDENKYGTLPLYFAVREGHTDVALSLIKHGASINQVDRDGNLPLHLAMREGGTDLALSLIKHGSSVNQEDRAANLPMAYYFDKDEKLNTELFTKLIPGSSMNILKAMCNTVERMTKRNLAFLSVNPLQKKENNQELLPWMLHQLIERLVLVEPLSISIELTYWRERRVPNNASIILDMRLNETTLITGMESFKPIYLCTVLLIISGCDISFPNAIAPWLHASVRAKYLSHAQAFDDLRFVYKQKNSVKRLQTLCIQKTRQSMVSLTDESFQSLPVPSCVRKLLLLHMHDAADVVCKANQMWPEYIPNEELILLVNGLE